MTSNIEKYLENVPDAVTDLTQQVLSELRTGSTDRMDSLNSRQQRLYDDLAALCLGHVVDTPQAASLLGQLGPNEEAYGLNLAMVNDAVLRVHYYTGEGSAMVDPLAMDSGLIDTAEFGAVHNHLGDISAVAPIGRVVHHCFGEIEGDSYTAGHMELEEADDPTKTYKYKRSFFVPDRPTGLESLSHTSVDGRSGYWMNKETAHIVSWPEPTVTVFINDFLDRHNSTIYLNGNITELKQKARGLEPAERQRIWEEFTSLVTSAGFAY